MKWWRMHLWTWINAREERHRPRCDRSREDRRMAAAYGADTHLRRYSEGLEKVSPSDVSSASQRISSIQPRRTRRRGIPAKNIRMNSTIRNRIRRTSLGRLPRHVIPSEPQQLWLSRCSWRGNGQVQGADGKSHLRPRCRSSPRHMAYGDAFHPRHDTELPRTLEHPEGDVLTPITIPAVTGELT